MYYRHGFGFRGASPPWPYVGRGRGGLSRCWHPEFATASPYPPPFFAGYPAWGPTPPPAQISKEEELGFLKEEANAVKGQLEEIENRIKELEARED